MLLCRQRLNQRWHGLSAIGFCQRLNGLSAHFVIGVSKLGQQVLKTRILLRRTFHLLFHFQFVVELLSFKQPLCYPTSAFAVRPCTVRSALCQPRQQTSQNQRRSPLSSSWPGTAILLHSLN